MNIPDFDPDRNDRIRDGLRSLVEKGSPRHRRHLASWASVVEVSRDEGRKLFGQAGWEWVKTNCLQLAAYHFHNESKGYSGSNCWVIEDAVYGLFPEYMDERPYTVKLPLLSAADLDAIQATYLARKEREGEEAEHDARNDWKYISDRSVEGYYMQPRGFQKWFGLGRFHGFPGCRELRRAVLDGGWSVDATACHVHIVQHLLGRSIGPAWDEYLGTRYADVKRSGCKYLPLAILNGKGIRSVKREAPRRMHDLLTRMHKEFRASWDELLGVCREYAGAATWDVVKNISARDQKKDARLPSSQWAGTVYAASKKKLVSYVMSDVERRIMEVVAGFGHPIAYVYDEVVFRNPIDLDSATSAVYDEVGIALTFKQERIALTFEQERISCSPSSPSSSSSPSPSSSKSSPKSGPKATAPTPTGQTASSLDGHQSIKASTKEPAMSTNQHKFSDSYERGLRGENAVAEFFDTCGLAYTEVTSRAAQKLGQDFVVEQHVTFEVKTDDMALETGNVFIETVSNDKKGTPGWARYTKADILLYIIGTKCIVCSPEVIRKMLDNWGERYAVKQCHNKHYSSEGITVPVHAFERDVSDATFDLQSKKDDDIEYMQALVKMFKDDRVSSGFPAETVAKLLRSFGAASFRTLQWQHVHKDGEEYWVDHADRDCCLTPFDHRQLVLWSIGAGRDIAGVYPLVTTYTKVKLLPMAHDDATARCNHVVLP